MIRPSGTVEGDTVYCYHKRGGCNCFDKLLDLARTHGTPVYLETAAGRMKLEPKDAHKRSQGQRYELSADGNGMRP